MLLQPVPANQTVHERIAWAESCFRSLGDLFLKEEQIVDLLREFEAAARVSKKRMDEIGVTALCRECDQEEGGSCCGKGLENRYGPWLLLINKLLAVDFPQERRQVDGCFFLGESGCLLKARHVICINYMCKKITGNIQPALINDLREVEGTEISALFMLNERIKSTFRKWTAQ